jgi:peptidoglycan/LPS O-acetylase OafA/YrhL
MYKYVFQEGSIGVSFFFILSGFILAYNYQNGILKKQKKIKAFYQARFARIFPLHFLTFIISIPLTHELFFQNERLWLIKALVNLSLTQSYIPIKSIYFSFNAPSWSISNEMFFYLIFPYLISLIPKIKNKNSVVIISITSIIPLLMLVVPEGYYHQILYINPLVRVIDFIIGIIIFNVYRIFVVKERDINYNYLEISALALLILFFVVHPFIIKEARYSYYYWIPIGYLIFSFAHQKGFISNVLSNKLFIHLGEISFGFYMFHQLVIRYFKILNNKFFHVENDYLIVVIIFTVSLVISHYSFVLYEVPVNKYLKNSLRNRKDSSHSI